MNKSSVALKIFYRTLALFLIIIALQVIFFSFFFESFHEQRRIDAMQEEIETVSGVVEASAAGQMDTLLGRFSEEEGVYTEAIDLSSETVFSVDESETFTVAGREIVMPPYLERIIYTEAFEVGSNVERVSLVPLHNEPIYFPVEITLGGQSGGELVVFGAGRPLAVPEQRQHLLVTRLTRKILDGVPAVSQLAGVAVDVAQPGLEYHDTLQPPLDLIRHIVSISERLKKALPFPSRFRQELPRTAPHRPRTAPSRRRPGGFYPSTPPR